MLLDRANELAAKITRYQTLKADATEAEQYATRAKQFSGAADRVAKTAQTWERLVSAGVSIDFVPTIAAGLADKSTLLKEAVKEDPTVLQDPPFDLKFDFTDRLLSLVTAADNASATSWRKWVSNESRLPSDDILEALSAIPQFKESISAIRQRRLGIAALGASVPDDVEATKARLLDLVADHNRAWTEMTADGIPPSVMAFIRACAGDGATIAMLRDDVRDWLDQRSLTDAFRIRIR